jgi:hypothetical protein
MGAVVREQGNPIPMVPKPIRGTRGPFLPNGRSTGEADSMLLATVRAEWMINKARLLFNGVMRRVDDDHRSQRSVGYAAYIQLARMCRSRTYGSKSALARIRLRG